MLTPDPDIPTRVGVNLGEWDFNGHDLGYPHTRGGEP